MALGNPNIKEAGVKTQFKPGQSGNPAGKPKGTKHINTWIQELLEDESFETVVTDAKKGIVEYKGAPVKAILMAQMHLALHSRDEAVRIKATDLLLKHGWTQKSEVANTHRMVQPLMSLEETNALPGNNGDQES